MYAKHKNLPATATFTTYYVGNAEYATLIGRVYALQMGGDRMAFVLESHDWGTDTDAYLSGEGDGYDPITVGTYQDPTEAEAELERRARAATAPEPLPGEQPLTHVFADAIDRLIGTEVDATVSNDQDAVSRDGDRVVAFINAHGPRRAQRASQQLKAGLPGASVHLDGTTVRVWVYATDARKLAEAVLA